MGARIVVSPNPAIVNSSAMVTATFPGGDPPGTVTISVKYNGVVTSTQSFTARPYEMGFIPVATGTHEACVSWQGGTDDKPFEVVDP